jgi:MSHA biogenesis protein MshQ
LQLTVQAQFWSGNAWVPNSADSCTMLSAAAVVRSGYLDNKGAPTAAWSTTASAVNVAGGSGALTLSAPSPTATGSVDLALNLGSSASDQSCLAVHPASTGAALPWLRSQQGSCSTAWNSDPAARASFGIYAPETRKTLHVREIY